MLDSLPSLCDAVYSSSSEEMTEPQIEKRLKPIWDAIDELKNRGSASGPTEAAPQGQTFWQRKPWATALLSSFITVIFGGLIVGFALPRIFDHAVGDLDSRIDSRAEKSLQDHHFADVQNSVDTMKGTLDRIGKDVDLLLTKNIKQSLALPPAEFRRQLPQLNGVLEASAKQKIPIEPDAIREVNNRLAPLVQKGDPEAWSATVSLASYRSVFNTNPWEQFSFKRVIPGGQSGFVDGESSYSNYNIPDVNGEPSASLSASIIAATPDTGALFEPLTQTLNPRAANAYITLQGGGVTLDGYRIRNAVFIGVHVVYNGGPVQIQNAIFINCRFTIQNGNAGAQFASKSITEERVNFSANV